MSEPQPNPHLQNPRQEWVNFEAILMLQIPLVRLIARLPAPFKPLEALPEKGLLVLGIQHITHCSFCDARDIGKLYLGYALPPVYGLGTATPRLSLYNAGIYTTSAVFSAALPALDGHRPYADRGLVLQLDAERLVLGAHDQDGPIFDLALSVGSPVYREVCIWGQQRQLFEGEAYVNSLSWQGEGFEHPGDPVVGKLYPHPFFGGLDLTGVDQQGYHQIVARPGHPGVVTLYDPQRELVSPRA